MRMQAAMSKYRKFYRKNDSLSSLGLPPEVDPVTSSWIQPVYLGEKGSTHREMGKKANIPYKRVN